MPTALKRKGSPSLADAEDSSKRRFAESEDVAPHTDANAATAAAPSPPTAADGDDTNNTSLNNDDTQSENQTTTTNDNPSALPSDAAAAASAPSDSSSSAGTRAARFAALKARSAAGRKSNLSSTKTEAQRAAVPTGALAALSRKRDTATHKLLQADAAARGEDFERKRAWDWTADEAARWDERVARKEANAAGNAFRDHAQEAHKVYERQVGQMGKDAAAWGERRAEYEAAKRKAIERAVAGGGLEVVELPGGELIAVDRDGSFVSTAGGAEEADRSQRPSKEAVDRLVADIRKAEEVRLRKRKERGGRGDEDGGDVTYINEKNKQFNMKLARFYDKYTKDIRDSFERGTAM